MSCRGCLMIGQPHTGECRARITTRVERPPAHAKRLEDNLNRRNEFATPETTVAVPDEGRTDATKRARQDELEMPQESANTSSLRLLVSRTLLSCPTRTPLGLTPMVLAFKENSTSKGTWGMVLLIVRALLRSSSFSGTPAVTFCSVHIHNVVAKKRDASTELLQRLHGDIKQHNVDFIWERLQHECFIHSW